MVLTFHLLFGAAIMAKIPFIPLAFFICILSHYFLDFLPHHDIYSVDNIYPVRDYKSTEEIQRKQISNGVNKRNWRKSFFDFLKVFLDFSLGVLFLLVLSKSFLLSFASGFLSTIPDGLTFLSIIFPENKFLGWHTNLHKNKVHYWRKKKIPIFWRIFSQLAIFIGGIFLLIF